ncbi:HAD family hydrolase [Zeaxanthinibacter sp. PT1]|uniref:HAD family hydrolase n=1 Tax=Zeaxanthinibacter TaxID=561554 RepID=UPI00234B7B66|nr:HAD family hydrolase [Zeaxanthinibacter sp. PT1]MDC6352766.1 HAD family hydrolase [Zeaxanthinibacter sp. PT1]
MDIRVNARTLIVFDLDDTLYNEIDYLRSAYTAIAKKIAKNDWRLLYSSMFSRYRCGEDVFGWLSSKYPFKKAELIDIYRTHKPNISLLEGAHNLMGEIKQKDGSLGILTDGRSHTQRNKISALGILELIDQVVISEEIGTEKPNRRNFEFFEDNSSYDKYYYIADNFKKDFISPNQLSWTTIGLIDNGKNIHMDGFKYMDGDLRPQHLIGSLNEIKIM